MKHRKTIYLLLVFLIVFGVLGFINGNNSVALSNLAVVLLVVSRLISPQRYVDVSPLVLKKRRRALVIYMGAGLIFGFLLIYLFLNFVI